MRRIFLIFVLLIGLQNSAFAQNQKAISPEQEFALNNSIFVLYHEIAHLLIDELDIPILGREENAADNFATLMLLRADSEQTNNALIDSAYGWFLSSENNEQDFYSDDDLYGEHNLDIQRAFQIVCLMVGRDPAIFSEIADEVGLDEDRQEACASDYEQASTSWDKVLAPFKNEDGAKIEVDIKYNRGFGLVSAGNLLRDNEFFENAVINILQKYNLPKIPSMRGKECHEANAYYDSWTGEVLYCYELVDEFIEAFRKNETEE